ncbi:bifunctional 3-(3-hydroxy-phenyl)propionate/3-hydroxycinnamic acid hydroxylase [Sinorhizobium sp. NFACC03]|uniref:bifunctional 3-(3-hydroxy-phenyl)propionate/3-hydroxycinnamic acid hydroxylase n=1 Tax=Sinorhizobium sp. NFACC03 TaxID=1566295 RepID=UPI000881545E|nr:bifunctional 3-(3-hydroxy-phenyl)propionate/3-hydroxycinnamic acid hydroxylase [Sinorhizobium sp. NFACC03]SDA93802.1 3-(3-hydroxy-phenyl)propionate hydroxylase [Sinorhizobium sp. NFACC03]
MENSVPVSTDVLVVGCGPVGATLALMLGRRGISTLVIDKAPDIYAAPRAIAFDFDALRILQSVGLDENDFDQVRIPYVRMVSPTFGEFARINTAREVDTHPMQITFYQPDLEQALRRRLTEIESVTFASQAELIDFRQSDEGIAAQIRLANGRVVEARARYLVGADGASSNVRTMIGQDFKGKSFVEDWLIVDAKNAREPIDHVEFLCDPKRPTPHMIAPGRRQRWEFMLSKGESRQQMEDDAEVGRLLAPWGGLAAMEIERRAVYRFHARSAASFHSGRVFLVGDAAHITPPFVGQGLVSGLRDAANLSWKLAFVVRGDAGAHILDSYDAERRPHSKAMINLARMMGKLIMPRNRFAAFASHGTIKLMRTIPGLRGVLEEQGIRPANRYRRGLFLKSARGDCPKPGYLLPQVWLVDRQGNQQRSDDVLGRNFALVGFGTDPEQYLDAYSHCILSSLEASKIWIAKPDQALTGPGAFMPKKAAPVPHAGTGNVVFVRPDRVVMAAGRAEEVNQMLRAAEQQMRGSVA